MEMTTQQNGTTLMIQVNGKLTFSDNAAFQNIPALSETQPPRQVEIDLSGLEYIDSSGLGMLLVLKEKCDHIGTTMILTNPKGQVAKILRIASIDRIIRIIN